MIQQMFGSMITMMMVKFCLNDVPHALGLVPQKLESGNPSQNPEATVAIIGCGVSGSYLYRMLKRQRPDVQVDLYSIPARTSCGIRPCGWLVSYPEFVRLISLVGLSPAHFIKDKFSHVKFNDNVLTANNAVINKPLLIQALLGGARPITTMPDISRYERVIDATGKRVYLSPRQDVFNVSIQQARFVNTHYRYPVGYAGAGMHELNYVIPLGDSTAHAGFGSLSRPSETRTEVERLVGGAHVICGCYSTLWVGGPTLPAVEGNVIGVGESIGLVDPLSGMGITPAMDSARALAEYWDSPVEYEKYIRREYQFMARLVEARESGVSTFDLLRLARSYLPECSLLGFRPGLLASRKILTGTREQ